MASRYALTTVATYSGFFKRPSILNDVTPASIRAPISSIVFKSFGLNKKSPTEESNVSPVERSTNSYGRRHVWAHAPRFPLRAPIILLIKHCPE